MAHFLKYPGLCRPTAPTFVDNGVLARDDHHSDQVICGSDT